jgi:hypothetical protein
MKQKLISIIGLILYSFLYSNTVESVCINTLEESPPMQDEFL